MAAPDGPASLDPIHTALAGIDPDRLTPREALDTLYRLKALIAVSADGTTVYD
jgi:DNA mismatch repair protein MutS